MALNARQLQDSARDVTLRQDSSSVGLGDQRKGYVGMDGFDIQMYFPNGICVPLYIQSFVWSVYLRVCVCE